MTRILFWLGLVFLVMFAIRTKLQGGRPPQPRRQAPPPDAERGGRRAAAAAAEIETMLCCAHCGIYYPASETVQAKGLDYCSAAHARLPAA
ncbi:PP0621 family protein [Rugamonas sp. DEMB1]|uniref:PP0621 family protein n=1 Tax=Rugamonas sp. DEMB1 TaxID=3039386 RepID=UPI00244BE46D|nr:PP0621 family protein [Rugamonas sp. DEMB1]WGG51209.1 PP0621 family protein [Rugamonas sp. DEMB1]